LAYKIQTPGNHPEENIQHTVNLLTTYGIAIVSFTPDDRTANDKDIEFILKIT
jgi:hypothetical protein